MKWQQWNHNATLWLTPCMHSNTRFSCLGYFGNLCSNICCNCSTPAFWTRPKQLLLLWYLYWRKNTVLQEQLLTQKVAIHTQNYSFSTHTAVMRHYTQLSPSRDARQWLLKRLDVSSSMALDTTCNQLEVLPRLPKRAHLLHLYDQSANLAPPRW